MKNSSAKYSALEAIRRAERQSVFAEDALVRHIERLADSSLELTRKEAADLKAAPAAVAGAMKVHIFAVFEQAARGCWADHFGRDGSIRTRDLIDGLAARCGVPEAVRNGAHAARDHRNDLVHFDRRSEPQAVGPMAKALRRFLSHFPAGWGRDA